MSYLVVGIVALVASALTLFTGFGLGTLLLPVFALLFPIAVAVAATAVVHAANNLFKLALLHKHAVKSIVLRFGLPAVVSAFGGAFMLTRLSGLDPLWIWQLGAKQATVTPIKSVMGILIIIFATLDLVPLLQRWQVSPRWLPVGGLLSGFFGGLSGHQGALRAAFLGRLKLEPLAFAATQTVIACMVDGSRLIVYGAQFFGNRWSGIETKQEWMIVLWATLCAFLGAFIARRFVEKLTVQRLRYLTGALLIIVGCGLSSGLV